MTVRATRNLALAVTEVAAEVNVGAELLSNNSNR